MGRGSALKTRLTALPAAVRSYLRGRSSGKTRKIVTEEDFRLQLRQNLSDLVDAWFPRTLDTEHGGFLCDFDHAWRPNGSQQKRLEFQARQTRASAQAAILDKANSGAREAAEHGFRYLTDVMWDNKHGGVFYMLHRNGTPINTDKHLHGIAYAIQAGVEHHFMTGGMKGVEFSKTIFDWMESHAHDPVNGGYYSYLEQDGTPITAPRADGSVRAPLGARIGWKDSNTMLDLIEALADLFDATGDAHVKERLTELVKICMANMVRPPGTFSRNYTADWKPADDSVEIGIVIQGACTLIKASKFMPVELRSDIYDAARLLVDTCIRDVWDGNDAGFFQTGVVMAGALTVQDDRKVWWVQAEGMRALLKLAYRDAEPDRDYLDRCLRLWSFIDSELIDHSRKGWHLSASSTRSPKAYVWKDASHEMRALVECIRQLDRRTGPPAGFAPAVTAAV